MTVFALLDDAQADAERPSSRLYTEFVHEHRCTDPADLEAVWAAASRELAGRDQAPLHAVLLADYEWGVALQAPALTEGRVPGALRLLMFRQMQRLDAQGVVVWLAQAEGSLEPGPAGVRGWHADVEAPAFDAAIAQIHDWIRAGETYQVNYTVRLRGEAWGSPLALYRRLRLRQPVAYGALIALPPEPADSGTAGADRQRWVLSCSPELFVQHQDGLLTTRPMKGTVARSEGADTDVDADHASARWLAADAKNRAENLMIVDLLRNDLGRIARVGSVRVPALFALEAYRTVFQMTSTVQAELPPETSLPTVLRALFPCGSITGAPKHRTLELISRLEASPRGLYTGAIGWLDAPTGVRALGDFCWSVAIRTLLLEAPRVEDGMLLRSATLGVGAGIVLDSQAAAERAECALKARYLTALDPGFTLFETVRCEGGQLHRLDAHLARLGASAQCLGFAFDAAAIRAGLAAAWAAQPPVAAERWRIDLPADGDWRLQRAALTPLPAGPVCLQWAAAPLPASEGLLVHHKTSLRSTYDASIQAATAAGAFDQLFMNARGELTEGARSNVFVQLEGQWFTPPLRSGVLPGVMRAAVLVDPAWRARERVLPVDELAAAEAWMVCNALRGCLMATAPAPYPVRPARPWMSA